MSIQSSDIPRIGKGVEGRAVRLGEVIGWIAAREEMPKGDAIDYAMQVLCGPESCTLYQIHVEGCSGKPLDVNVEWFASHNGKEDGHTGGRRADDEPGRGDDRGPVAAPGRVDTTGAHGRGEARQGPCQQGPPNRVYTGLRHGSVSVSGCTCRDICN